MNGDLQEATDDAIGAVNFLTQSPVRVELLRRLDEADRVSRTELRDQFDVSRVTVKRNLDALEERDWITNSRQEYRIRPLGSVVVEAIETALVTANFAETIRPFLRWFPEDELTFDVRELADATVVVSSATDPYAPVNRHIEAIRRASEVRCLLPAIGLPAMRAVRECLAEREQRHEVVFSPEIEATIRAEREYRELAAELAAFDRYAARVSEREIGYYLGRFDDIVQIGVEDDDGVPQALVETDSDEIRRWATRTYESYRSRSRPFALTA